MKLCMEESTVSHLLGRNRREIDIGSRVGIVNDSDISFGSGSFVSRSESPEDVYGLTVETVRV